MSGADFARMMLFENDIVTKVQIGDHNYFNPKTRIVYLDTYTFYSNSTRASFEATHEAAHACQNLRWWKVIRFIPLLNMAYQIYLEDNANRRAELWLKSKQVWYIGASKAKKESFRTYLVAVAGPFGALIYYLIEHYHDSVEFRA